MEIWKPILSGYYEVSNIGNVRRAKDGENTYAGRMAKPSRSGNGYMIFGAYIGGKRKNVLVHRAVAEAFLGECPLNHQVNHIDGVKTNNRAENLEYLTISDNQKHAIKLGLSKAPTERVRGKDHWTKKYPSRVARGANNGSVKHPEKLHRGEKCHLSKLDEEKVKAIKSLIGIGTMSYSAIGRIFGVSHNNIIHIARGKTWAHVK